MNIEIGGGHLLPAGSVNLDPNHGQDGWRRLAQDVPWPTPDGSVSAVRASHVMEHVPAGQPRIDVFNEAHRVLAPGGTFEVIVPCIPTDGSPPTWHAIADPTHVSFWCKESFYYLDGTFAANADYGVKLWETVSLEVEGGWSCRWVGHPR